MLYGAFEHLQIQQTFYSEDRMEAEKFVLFGADFCQEVLHQLLGVDPSGGNGQGTCAVERSVVLLDRLNAWVTSVVTVSGRKKTMRLALAKAVC